MKLVPVGPRDFAEVDDEDYDRVVAAGPWSLIENGHQSRYAKRRERMSKDPYPDYSTLSMHHLITGWDYVDHIDGDGLNNQKWNLRQATHAQNIQNQRVQERSLSGYRGVTHFPNAGIYKRRKPWRARIKIDGVDTTIGYYETPEEAARVWNEVAYQAWGEFAYQNPV